MEHDLIVTSQNNAKRCWSKHQSAIFIIFTIFLTGLLVYPFPVLIVQNHYPFHLSYFAWSIAILAVFVAIRVKEYHSFLTVFVWGLRWLISVEFLLVSLQTQSVEIVDIISWVGVLAPTFFYEIGCIIIAYRKTWVVLKIFIFVYVITVLPVSIAAIITLVQGGVQGLLDSTNILRYLHPSWPNYIAVMIAICILITKEIAAIHRGYRLFLMLFILIIGLTLSRTGIVALICGLLSERLSRSKKKVSLSVFRRSSKMHFWSRIFLVLIILSMACFIFKNKDISFGSTISYTINTRIARWSQAIHILADNPFFGVGFRSFTKSLPDYEFGDKIQSIGSSHNDFIDLLVRGGAIYFLIYLSFIIFYLNRCWRKDSNMIFSIEKINLSIPIAVLSSAMVQNPLKDPQIVSLFWLFIGLGTACNGRNIR